MSSPRRPILVVEDDAFTRVIQVVLDPDTPADRVAAFADFFAHDEPDFAGWCESVRRDTSGLYPADVRMVVSEDEMRVNLANAVGLVVESFKVSVADLAVAPSLRVVQKYGAVTRNIDLEACRAKGIVVRTQRRRANIGCTEHVFAMMLDLGRRLHEVRNRVTPDQLLAAGFKPTWFGTGHTSIGGWPRVPNVNMLYESTIGLIGMGEIGHEIALRSAAFGMRPLYYQRTRLSTDEEKALGLTYASLDTLLAESDWLTIQLPNNASTRDLINRELFALMKPGAMLINISPAPIVNRDALLEALASGHLGGFGLDMLYEEPGRADDELLGFENVILTPHIGAAPRFNALQDLREVIVGLAEAVGSSTR